MQSLTLEGCFHIHLKCYIPEKHLGGSSSMICDITYNLQGNPVPNFSIQRFSLTDIPDLQVRVILEHTVSSPNPRYCGHKMLLHDLQVHI